MLAPALLPSAQAAESKTLEVRAYSTDIDELSMYAEIKISNEVVKSGYTPLTYTGSEDEVYTVEMYNYNDRVFSHWGGGSGSSNPRTLTLWDDTDATAYYNIESTYDIESVSVAESDEVQVSGTGILVSLYMYPSSEGSTYWQQVIDEKNEHPSVPVVAIFNPSSGPGFSENSKFDYWVDRLQDAGVKAIGYVSDDYGTKSVDTLKEQANKYKEWYNADGLFIDEFTNKVGSEDHYRELTEYAKSLGMDLVVGNPGTDVPATYIGTVDVINTSEGAGYIDSTHPNIVGSSWVNDGYSGWHDDYDKSNFALVRYDIDWLDSDFVTEVSDSMGLVYLTSGTTSDGRWFSLPSYYGDLVEELED